MELDYKSFYKYLACTAAGAALGAGSMYKLTDYFAYVTESSKFTEYSLEGLATLIGAGAGIKIGDWFYENGMRGVVDKFYPTACAFIGAKGGFELGELIAENMEDSEGLTNALEWVITATGLMSGIIAGRKIRKAIADYNKKRNKTTQQP